MIVNKDKSYNKNSLYPNTDWIGNADFILDDNKEKDAEIEEKIISMYPNFDFVLNDDGTKIIDVVATEPQPVPEKLPEPPTNAELAAAIAELAVVKIFVYQVRTGKMTIEDVPERWREQVRKELNNGDN